jgi:hypothetical protein
LPGPSIWPQDAGYGAPNTEERSMSAATRALIEKIEALPAERIVEVEDFVDFIAAREQDRALTRAAAEASASSFARVWGNPDDDAYDAL